MKLRNLFTLSVAALTLVACNSGGNGGNKTPAAEAACQEFVKYFWAASADELAEPELDTNYYLLGADDEDGVGFDLYYTGGNFGTSYTVETIGAYLVSLATTIYAEDKLTVVTEAGLNDDGEYEFEVVIDASVFGEKVFGGFYSYEISTGIVGEADFALASDVLGE